MWAEIILQSNGSSSRQFVNRNQSARQRHREPYLLRGAALSRDQRLNVANNASPWERIETIGQSLLTKRTTYQSFHMQVTGLTTFTYGLRVIQSSFQY